MYTDDTQMSIAVAELLNEGKEFDRENLAEKFIEAYKRDPIPRYSNRTKSLLESSKNGKEFIQKAYAVSESNGAVMRCVPLGLIKDSNEVMKYAKLNSKLSHDSSKSIASCVTISLLSHYNFHYGRNPDKNEIMLYVEEIDESLSKYIKSIIEMKSFETKNILGKSNEEKGVPVDAMRTTGSVFYLIYNYTDPQEILKNAVELGGDTDSVASIALGINLINQDPNKLPKSLLENLANYEYGKDYLLELGNKLSLKYLPRIFQANHELNQFLSSF